MADFPSTLPLPSVNYGFDVKGRALIGRQERAYRQARLRDGRKVYLFNVSWEFLASEMVTFSTFVGTTLGNGKLPFNLTLASGDGTETHEVRFLDAKFSESVSAGPMYTVTAQLICEDPPIWDETQLDEWLAVDPDDFDFLLLIDPLEYLVEVYLPTFL